jgi:hypothetical protein
MKKESIFKNIVQGDCEHRGSVVLGKIYAYNIIKLRYVS